MVENSTNGNPMSAESHYNGHPKNGHPKNGQWIQPGLSNPIGTQPDIQFEAAGVRQGDRLLWSNLSLSVQQGEFIAILGPNGAGKSTLLKTILGLQSLSEGWVTVLGNPARRGNAAVSYLPQRHSFDADIHIRGRDLVSLGVNGTHWGVPIPLLRRLWRGDIQAREEQRRVQQSIERVNATAYADRAIGELSGGEQQRLLIAQALVTRPRILLLDEPLDSLDLRNQQAVSALIRQICEEYRVTVLLVAHDVNPILPYLDRVLYIGRDQVVVGKPEAVITSETLSHLYDAPIDVLRTRDGRIIVAGQPEEVTYHAHRSRDR
jgi:zinc/manganese transport system ATP-binding protein